MACTDLLSRLSLGKALSPSHYDEEFVVASIDKSRKILSNRGYFNRAKINSVAKPSSTKPH